MTTEIRQSERQVKCMLPNLQDLRDCSCNKDDYCAHSYRCNLIPHIMEIEDPKIMRIKLEDMFQSRSMDKRWTLESQSFYSLKLIEETANDRRIPAECKLHN